MAQISSSSASSERRGSLQLLSSRWKSLLSNRELTDVEFAVGRQCGAVKTFRAHKLVLSVSSDVFQAMFDGSWAERCASVIQIPEIPPDAFANMLSYMYTDTMEHLAAENAVQTLYCADKYDLPWLAELCTNFILDHLTAYNCLIYLEHALRWTPPCDAVLEKCWDIVDASSAIVLQSEHLPALDRSTLEMILRRNTLSADENTICTAVDKWATAACARNNLDASAANRRQMLGDALLLLRFPLLTDAALADGPVQSELLTPAERDDIHRYNHASPHRKPPLPFRSDPRRYAAQITSQSVFKLYEKVFVKGAAGGWYPAQVLGDRQLNGTSRVPLEWYSRMMQEKTAEVSDVIQAADILRRGRRVDVFDGEVFVEGMYVVRRAGWHIVILDGKERSVELADLIISDKEVGVESREGGCLITDCIPLLRDIPFLLLLLPFVNCISILEVCCEIFLWSCCICFFPMTFYSVCYRVREKLPLIIGRFFGFIFLFFYIGAAVDFFMLC
ncbi:BTB/POZ domain-containing protein 6-B-like [Paramacrobiotus metropolitanus]|uniref:BTB/POZ domain-containing protein 6-B-like n=1 Tax=Paramacrobiotus metropolitanus TaxID=2943436 RepID=UPI002445832F|nr:BTB/POZ domain-containing protein 6-B-like [Paramacrobiotus metropolitanus]